jgi:putative endonuclease
MRGVPWFLYLIECQDGSVYTGITVDVAKRYAAHETGKGAKYMRSHPPKQLLKVFEYPNRSEASKAEYAVKQLTAIEKRSLVQRKSFAYEALVKVVTINCADLKHPILRV